MTDDFVTRLGHALREAADREERRGAPARAAAAARASVPRLAPSPAMAMLAVGAVLAFAVYAVTALRPEPAQPPGPKVVARLAPAEQLDQVVAGFGSAWLVDTARPALLRMDPASRRVTARIALRGQVGIAVGNGAVWVAEQVNNTGDLLRIDPGTNRVVARIDTRDVGFPIAIGNTVWVVGPERALRVDARTNQVTKQLTIAHSGYVVRGGTTIGGDLWALVSSGHIMRFDGRTGARKATFQARFDGLPAAFGGSLYLANAGQVARLDPATGRTLWLTRIDQVGPGAAAGGLLWGEAHDRGGDRVVAIDPRNGRIVSSVHVGEFGAMWMERVGSELWMTTAGGHVVVIRP